MVDAIIYIEHYAMIGSITCQSNFRLERTYRLIYLLFYVISNNWFDFFNEWFNLLVLYCKNTISMQGSFQRWNLIYCSIEPYFCISHLKYLNQCLKICEPFTLANLVIRYFLKGIIIKKCTFKNYLWFLNLVNNHIGWTIYLKEYFQLKSRLFK